MRAAVKAAASESRRNGRGPGAVRRKSRRTVGLRLFVVPRVALLALGGCSGGALAGGGLPGSDGPDAASRAGPVEVVEAFLAAAGHRDHAAMARHFGTAAGPIGDRGGTLGCALRKVGSWVGIGDRCLTGREVELRMDLMSAILAHQSHRVGGQETVAGRSRPATRIEVEVDTLSEQGVLVPFILIQAHNGAWLVEEVDLERLTG